MTTTDGRLALWRVKKIAERLDAHAAHTHMVCDDEDREPTADEVAALAELTVRLAAETRALLNLPRTEDEESDK